MTMTRGSEIVTKQHVTTDGSADTVQAGTVTTPARGTMYAGSTSVPADVTTPAGNRDQIHPGTVTGTAGHVSSTVPGSSSRVRRFPSPWRRRRNHGHVTENHGHVPTVPVPAPTVAEPAPAPTGPRHAAGMESPAGSSAKTWLTIVVAIVASLGQVQTARAKDFVHMVELSWPIAFDVTPWLAVAVFDLSVAALLYGGRAVIRQGLSPWPFWYAAAGVAGLSIYTNTQHKGAVISASASLVLFITWFLTLLAEYRKWRMDNGQLADVAPQLLLSRLMLINRRLTLQAWRIAATRPLARGVAYRKALGEDINIRDLAILAARLYLDILDDQVVAQLNPEGGKKIGWFQRSKRRAAINRAVMTAGDAVDRLLGLPVIERTGVKVARIGYTAPDPQPTMAPAPRRAAAVEDAPAQPAAPRPPAVKVSTGIPVVSAPPAQATATVAGEVPEVPEELFEVHAERITLVQERAGDGWWAGDGPLTVDDVQKTYGIGNRKHATVVARCLKVLRARRLADEQGSTVPHSTEGGDVR